MNYQLLHRLLAKSLQGRFKSQSNPSLASAGGSSLGGQSWRRRLTPAQVFLSLPRIQDKENT